MKTLPRQSLSTIIKSLKKRHRSGYFFSVFVFLSPRSFTPPSSPVSATLSHPPPLLRSPMITPKLTAALAVVLTATTAQAATPTTNYLPQTSPAWLASIPLPTGVIQSWPVATAAPRGNLTTGFFTNYTFPGYPEENKIVTGAATDPNIVAAMKLIDWTHVPNAPPTTSSTMKSYNSSDPFCWW